MSLAVTLIQLIVLSAVVIGAGYALTSVPSIKWPDILVAAGFGGLPLVLIVALHGGLSEIATAAIFGLFGGHVLTHLDSD